MDRNAGGLLCVAFIVRLSGDQWLSRDEIAPKYRESERERERERESERGGFPRRRKVGGSRAIDSHRPILMAPARFCKQLLLARLVGQVPPCVHCARTRDRFARTHRSARLSPNRQTAISLNSENSRSCRRRRRRPNPPRPIPVAPCWGGGGGERRR